MVFFKFFFNTFLLFFTTVSTSDLVICDERLNAKNQDHTQKPDWGLGLSSSLYSTISFTTGIRTTTSLDKIRPGRLSNTKMAAELTQQPTWSRPQQQAMEEKMVHPEYTKSANYAVMIGLIFKYNKSNVVIKNPTTFTIQILFSSAGPKAVSGETKLWQSQTSCQSESEFMPVRVRVHASQSQSSCQSDSEVMSVDTWHVHGWSPTLFLRTCFILRTCFKENFFRSPGHPFSPTLSMGVSSPPVFCGWPWRARILARTRHSPLARGSRTFHPYRTRPSWHPHNLLHPRVPPPSPFPCIARIRTSRPRCPCNWTGHAQRSSGDAIITSPWLTFILNSCPAFASRLPLAASSPVIKCSTQCVASPIPSPADWLALAKPYNKCPLPHLGVGSVNAYPLPWPLSIKCDSVPWANYFTQGQKGPVHAGFQTGNLLQLTFPTQKPYTLKDHSAFAFCLIPYLCYPSRTHNS